jgi:hypothetical protein
MSMKKNKIFSGKNILKYLKNSNGSIAIIVLIIGIAIVLTVGALSAYMIKDIKFTQLDEQKLKALNIAEAGLSNMYSNLYKYYNNGTQLPVSPYQGELKDGTEVLGTYYIVYEPFYTNGIFSGYIINSKGVEAKSQVARKVGIRINVTQQGSSFGIYDFIYTGLSSVLGPNGNVIDGPFYTEGDLTITNGAGMLQTFNSGPVVVKGNLTMDGDTVSLTSNSLKVGGNVLMEGSAKIKGGPVSIAGNLTMSGGTLIGNPLASPIIVMGNIDMSSGSPQIGMPGVDLVLSCPGSVTNPAWAPIYATRDNSLTYTFTDPLFNVNNLVNTYKSGVQSTALIISENVTLVDTVGFSYSRSSGTNSLSFGKASDGRWVLDIRGNVIINGSLTIGGTSWYPLSTNTIYYTGSGTIYTTANILSNAKLIPANLISDSFPESELLVLITEQNITFDIFNFWDPPDCANANIFTVAIAKGNITAVDGTIKGTLIAGGTLNINKDFGKVCYESGISEHLPPDLPDSSSGSGGTTFTQVEWQELTP